MIKAPSDIIFRHFILSFKHMTTVKFQSQLKFISFSGCWKKIKTYLWSINLIVSFVCTSMLQKLIVSHSMVILNTIFLSQVIRNNSQHWFDGRMNIWSLYTKSNIGY